MSEAGEDEQQTLPNNDVSTIRRSTRSSSIPMPVGEVSIWQKLNVKCKEEFCGASLSREQYEELWKATQGFTYGGDHVRDNIGWFHSLAQAKHDIVIFYIKQRKTLMLSGNKENTSSVFRKRLQKEVDKEEKKVPK